LRHPQINTGDGHLIETDYRLRFIAGSILKAPVSSMKPHFFASIVAGARPSENSRASRNLSDITIFPVPSIKPTS